MTKNDGPASETPRAPYTPEAWESAEWAIPPHIHSLGAIDWIVPNCDGDWKPPTPEKVRSYIAQAICRHLKKYQPDVKQELTAAQATTTQLREELRVAEQLLAVSNRTIAELRDRLATAKKDARTEQIAGYELCRSQLTLWLDTWGESLQGAATLAFNNATFDAAISQSPAAEEPDDAELYRWLCHETAALYSFVSVWTRGSNGDNADRAVRASYETWNQRDAQSPAPITAGTAQTNTPKAMSIMQEPARFPAQTEERKGERRDYASAWPDLIAHPMRRDEPNRRRQRTGSAKDRK